MNIDYYLLTITSVGFIFGWIAGRSNYKHRLVKWLQETNYEGKSSNEAFTEGMHRGVSALKMYIISSIKHNKVGKENYLSLSSKNDLLDKLSKKNNKD